LRPYILATVQIDEGFTTVEAYVQRICNHKLGFADSAVVFSPKYDWLRSKLVVGEIHAVTRVGNRPDRRIVGLGDLKSELLAALAQRIEYVGSPHHKLYPGDYGFHPPSNPRATKSVCDDHRSVLLQESLTIFKCGIELGMVSRFGETDNPKYVWAVDTAGEAYEAKESKSRPNTYHGYRLGEDEPMRNLVLKEWNRRCPQR
jgi:hypothetical protein